MEPEAILLADPLDLLFENRNKSYGAFTLRKFDKQRLMIALGAIFSGVLICFILFPQFRSATLPPRVLNTPDLYLGTVTPPSEKPVLPPPKPVITRPSAAILFTKPLITDKLPVPKPMARIDELDRNAIGLNITAGEQDDGQPENNGHAGASAAAVKTDSLEKTPQVLDRAEVMPEFPGGPEALKRFLGKNLRMPGNGLEPGGRVMVVARFIVGADGRVRDIEIIPGAGGVFDTEQRRDAFDAEVRRVISKMPDWKPGSQNHRHVSVYFRLPVNFIGEEQGMRP